jgi:hypothetical protein
MICSFNEWLMESKKMDPFVDFRKTWNREIIKRGLIPVFGWKSDLLFDEKSSLQTLLKLDNPSIDWSNLEDQQGFLKRLIYWDKKGLETFDKDVQKKAIDLVKDMIKDYKEALKKIK